MKTRPWERQEGETEKAYQAFTTYRNFGEERTLIKVSETLHKSYTLIRRWRDAWDWDERVRAYDNDLEAEAKKEVAKELRSMVKRHIGIAMRMQKKALDSLENIATDEMSPKDIKDFFKIATELERQSRISEQTILENEKLTMDSTNPPVINVVFEGDKE